MEQGLSVQEGGRGWLPPRESENSLLRTVVTKNSILSPDNEMPCIKNEGNNSKLITRITFLITLALYALGVRDVCCSTVTERLFKMLHEKKNAT